GAAESTAPCEAGAVRESAAAVIGKGPSGTGRGHDGAHRPTGRAPVSLSVSSPAAATGPVRGRLLEPRRTASGTRCSGHGAHREARDRRGGDRLPGPRELLAATAQHVDPV